VGVKAGLAYTLSEAADDGHCYLPEHVLVADATKILGVPDSLIAPQIPDLAAEELAVRDELPVPGTAATGQLQAVYLPPFYHSERSLASSLSRLLSSRADRLAAFQAVDWDRPWSG
jgi:exodeoxyribonuclease V alpha subunit